MKRTSALAGLTVSAALTFSATSALAFFDYQKLDRIWVRLSLLEECDTEMQLGVYKVPLPLILQRMVELNGAPPGEYDLILDPAKWGQDKAILVTREDLIIKPKPQKTKDVHGIKMKVLPAGMSQQYYDNWFKSFERGFHYTSLHPLKKGSVAAKSAPFAMLVDIPPEYFNALSPWTVSTPEHVKVLSQDLGKEVIVKRVNIRFKNTDGRWNVYAQPQSQRPDGRVPDLVPQPATLPPRPPRT